MSALTTDFRNEIVTALGTVVATVYDTAPPIPATPAVTIVAAEPWMLPKIIGGRLRVESRWRLMCAVQDSRAHVAALESLVEDVLLVLPDGVLVEEVTAPVSLDTGNNSSVLVSEVRITAHLKEA